MFLATDDTVNTDKTCVYLRSSVAFRLCHQPVLKYCNLRVNHAVEVQLAAASEGRCFAVFASAFGCVEFSSLASRTSRAAEGSSPARQIISVKASIFSSLEWTYRLSMIFSPASTERTRSGSHGSFISNP